MADPREKRTIPLPAAARAGRRFALRQGVLTVSEGPDAGRRFLFTPPRLSIGTLEDNDVVLTDGTVSKRHATIEETPEGILVKDLGSSNGTQIDGNRIREAYLGSGATLTVGGTVMRFEAPRETVKVTHSVRGAFGGFRGESPAVRELFGVLERIAASDLSVLITAETGAGKEVIAQSIHDQSKRAKKPFVVFDCSAVSHELVESALFGHKSGAFTGAKDARLGAFQSAEGGTLFLDEIGELDREVQPKLLRALEKRQVTPLGSDQPVPVNIRVLAATNRDLRGMVAEGTFRRDLFYRLAGVELHIPPLRERRADIPLLAKHFLEQAGEAADRLTDEALAKLAAAAWPGNTRELKNVVERALALVPDRPIEARDLQFEVPIGAAREEAAADPAAPVAGGDRSLEEIEAEAILATLKKTNWNKSQAARVLGITRGTLAEKIQRYKLGE